MAGTVNGFVLAYGAAGGIILWSGIAGTSISDTFRAVLQGKSPSQLPVTEPIAVASGTSAEVPAATPALVNSTDAANQAIGQRLAAGFGWGSGAQWNALNSLIEGESGWNNNAQNPTSTAYGIGQFLDSTWAAVGAKKTSDPTAQIFATLVYIKVRYGSPVTAYNDWLSRNPHWY